MDELKDIKIGPGNNDWIEWIEFDPDKSELLDVDLLILERKEFWDKLEVECVKECCGFDAYSFYPETISAAKKNEKEFDNYLENFIKQVVKSKNIILISGYMNQLVHKTTFLKLLEHIKRIK